MERSRFGVSHNCIVELHSKVAHIRKKPETKHTPTSNGTQSVYTQIRLQMTSAIQHVMKATFEVNWNFKRNMMANVSAMPTIEA